jgi:transposase
MAATTSVSSIASWRPKGYTTSRSLLREALRTWLTPDEQRAHRRDPRKQRSRTRRMNTRWVCLRPPERLDEEERATRRVLDEDLPLATAHVLMQRFRQVVRDRGLLGLNRWLADAASSELPPFVGFTRGIANDRAAVDAAFTLPWSTSPVEGHVHKSGNTCATGRGTTVESQQNAGPPRPGDHSTDLRTPDA